VHNTGRENGNALDINPINTKKELKFRNNQPQTRFCGHYNSSASNIQRSISVYFPDGT